MTELENIKDITGTDVNTCACSECRQQCKVSPCLGTPSDILAIVKAGFFQRIVYTKWAAGVKQGIPVINMLQPYYDTARGCCTFLDDTQKHCILHEAGIKPTQGKLMHHSLGILGVKLGAYLPIEHAVALTWTGDENMPVVMEIANAIKEKIESAVENN